jgi:hypothetical protein
MVGRGRFGCGEARETRQVVRTQPNERLVEELIEELRRFIQSIDEETISPDSRLERQLTIARRTVAEFDAELDASRHRVFSSGAPMTR